MLQFAGIVFLGVTGPGLPKRPVAALLVWGGVALGFWALWTMRKNRFHIIPEVSLYAHLVTTGPYRIVRNPMYLAVLITTLGWVVETPTPLRALVWVGIVVTLAVKLLYEERLLRERFPEYGQYKQKTRRLIPGVW